MRTFLIGAASVAMVGGIGSVAVILYKINAYERRFETSVSSADRCQATTEGAAYMRSLTLFEMAETLEKKGKFDCTMASFYDSLDN